MRIRLDYHGVIDTYPVYFSQMSKALIEKSHDVHIITGHESVQVKDTNPDSTYFNEVFPRQLCNLELKV